MDNFLCITWGFKRKFSPEVLVFLQAGPRRVLADVASGFMVSAHTVGSEMLDGSREATINWEAHQPRFEP